MSQGYLGVSKNEGPVGRVVLFKFEIYLMASMLLVCGKGGNHAGCPVSFCRLAKYRSGVSTASLYGGLTAATTSTTLR